MSVLVACALFFHMERRSVCEKVRGGGGRRLALDQTGSTRSGLTSAAGADDGAGLADGARRRAAGRLSRRVAGADATGIGPFQTGGVLIAEGWNGDGLWAGLRLAGGRKRRRRARLIGVNGGCGKENGERQSARRR